MNTKIYLSIGIFAVAGLTSLPSSPARAADVRVVEVQPASLLQTLQDAYVTLSSANHDYDGHRAAAMKDIAATASMLGRDITGDGRGREPQALSDLQIRSVQMNLVTVGRVSPPGVRHPEYVGHINGAIHELSLALESEAPKGAARPGVKVEVVDNVVESNAVETGSLQRIYEVLAQANHDYKGHRASAMEHISKACKTLGSGIVGDGRGRENQATSDQQLIQAQTLLVQVRDSFSANDPKRVLKELDGAVGELSAALSVK